jgi:hypothetical protein
VRRRVHQFDILETEDEQEQRTGRPAVEKGFVPEMMERTSVRLRTSFCMSHSSPKSVEYCSTVTDHAKNSIQSYYVPTIYSIQGRDLRGSSPTSPATIDVADRRSG